MTFSLVFVNLNYIVVNGNISSKNRILEALRNASAPLTGDELAESSGISRVAVWKAVQSLIESGYKIESSRHGYSLTEDLKDSLFPWEFGKEEEYFSHFTETDSTMIQARNLAQKKTETAESLNENNKVPYIQIITADRQTKGKSQGGRKWTTTEGSLAFTLVYKAPVPVAKSSLVRAAAQIALVRTLKTVSDRQIYLRWPCDVCSEKGKLAGILDEVSASGGICDWINIGIGVNLTKCPDIPGTDSVFENEAPVSRKDILELFLKEFKKTVALIDSKDLLEQWNSLSVDFGKEISVEETDEKYIFKGIDSFGGALLDDGKTERVFYPGVINIKK